MQTTKLSVITATKPARLSKGFSLDGSGNLRKLHGGNLVEGEIKNQALETLGDLAKILKSLTPTQALVYGVPINPASKLMTRKAFANADCPAGATTRTNDAFRWPDGPGVMMLDYDPMAGGKALCRDELVQAIRTAAPGLADAEMLWWPSASSCIWADDRELRGIMGQRLYILVKDAADIPRAGAALVARLWLAGFGHIEISKSGALLERSLVDASVWQASRLDFAGGAACGLGLEQRRGDPLIIHGGAQLIDSSTALPDLNAVERDQVAAIKAEAKAAAQPEAEGMRTAWIEGRVQEMVATEDRADPEAIQAAESIARRALETGVLAGDFRVLVEKDAKLVSIAVGDLLDNRDRWHGCITKDPIEPDYDGGRMVGRLFLMQARPTLYSFAHGGKAYKLHRAPTRIELVKGHTAEAATATIELLRRDPVVFDFGGQLALAENGRVHPLCENALAHHLGNLTQFWKFNADGDQVDSDPPATLLKQTIAQGERRKLKPLDGIITVPTIRLDGSVLAVPGYDPATRLLFDPQGEEVPEVPTQPTLDQARAALEALMYPFNSFPFVDATAKGALLAGMLTAVIRPALATAPAFAFDAPIQGSGKTLLAGCVGALAEGRAPDIWPHTAGRDDEETRKRLFTALRTGGRTLVWDNIVGVFDSAAMAAFITADAMIDRILGKSEAVRIPNRTLLLLTGNNLSLAGDLPRRVIICRIDPQTATPFARAFALDPLQWVLDHRMAMAAAACTLIRGRLTHMAAQAPGRLASFEDWDNLVRQTVVWADRALERGIFGDPMDLVKEAQAADPEGESLFALLDALRDEFRQREFSAKDVQVAARSSMTTAALEPALLDLAGDRAVHSVKSLGRVLKNREGRIVNGMRLVSRADTNAGTRMFRVLLDAKETGLTGLTGLAPTPCEKIQTSPFFIEASETNPSKPLNPENTGSEFW